jgi:hypothetical protein
MNGDIIAVMLARVQAWGEASLSPWYVLGLCALAIIVGQLIVQQRSLYGVRMHPVWRDAVVLVVFGWMCSAVVAMTGLVIDVSEGLARLMWIVLLLVACVRIAYARIAYVGALLIASSVAAAIVPAPESVPGGVRMFWHLLASIDVPSLCVLVGVTALIEAAVLLVYGGRWAMPAYVRGERLKPIGAYALIVFCPLPLIVWNSSGVVAIPLLIASVAWVTSGSVRVRLRSTVRMLVLYALALCAVGAAGMMWASQWIPIVQWSFALLCALFCAGAYGAVYASLSKTRGVLLTNNNKGLRVLAVAKKSVAAKLGIVPGDIVHKMHGRRIRTLADVYAARLSHPTTVRIDVMDARGDVRIVQQAVYEHDGALLGIVYCPEEGTGMVQKLRGLASLFVR